MTDDRSLERAARSFIEVGPTRAPEHAVDAALLRIQTTTQERDWFPWRFPQMITPVRIGALVAIGAIVLAGLGLLVGGAGSSPPAPSPSPSPVEIPDGTYVAQPQRVADLLAHIEADDALTAADRDALIDSVLGIRGATTFEVAIQVIGDSFTTLTKRDTGAFEPDEPWTIDAVAGSTVTFSIPCCGAQDYEVTRSAADGAFTMRALTEVSAMEAAARQILFEAGPFAPVPATSPSPAAAAPVPMPVTIRGDWQAEADAIVRNVANRGEPLQLSLDWDTGESAWIQPPRGDNVYVSTPVAAPEGELAFMDSGSFVGCAPGDIGRYGWERSADGLFLTLTVISDACTGRAEAFGRTWVHSLSAVTDGGPGVIPWGGRWIRATFPSMRFGLSGPPDVADFQTFDATDPDVALTIFRNPMGWSDPCATDGGTPATIASTMDAVVDYVRGLPGASVTTAETTVGGLPAVHLTVDLTADADCTLGELPAFHAARPTDEGTWSMTADGSHSLWIVQDGTDVVVIWYEGEGITVADEQALIDSLSFLDDLPAP